MELVSGFGFSEVYIRYLGSHRVVLCRKETSVPSVDSEKSYHDSVWAKNESNSTVPAVFKLVRANADSEFRSQSSKADKSIQKQPRML